MQIQTVKSKFNFKKFAKKLWIDLVKEPLYILFHPIKGFYEFKTEKKFKPYVAIFYLVIMCLLQVISFNGEGFLVNENNPSQFNSLQLIALVILPVALISIGNWSITCLFNGKGTMKEIFYVICYSLFPYVIITIPALIYSNFLVNEEITFYVAFNFIAAFALVFMVFFGLMQIQEYGLVKNVFTLVFTIVAMGVIVFIIFLFFILFQNIFSFLYSVWQEFVLKFL